MLTKRDYAYILKWAKKLKAINILGGKCSNCNITDIHLLEFHHLCDKHFEIGQSINSGIRWSDLESELKKCIILCGNCHRDYHVDDQLRTGRIKASLFDIIGINACIKCGYNGCGLNFHHKNPADKEFKISEMISKNKGISHEGAVNYQLLLDEISKCSVMCDNCHRTEHFDFNKYKKFENDIIIKSMSHVETPSEISIDDVARLLNMGFNKAQVAKELGCSKSTITKYSKLIK